MNQEKGSNLIRPLFLVEGGGRANHRTISDPIKVWGGAKSWEFTPGKKGGQKRRGYSVWCVNQHVEFVLSRCFYMKGKGQGRGKFFCGIFDQ